MKPPKELKMKKEMWDTVLLWSGYDGYFSIAEIAQMREESEGTIRSRIRRFAERYPQAYETVLADRSAIKATTTRLTDRLSHPVSFKPEMESYIKETF